MRLDVQIDTSALKARTLREAKNLAYSTSQALNATAKDVQAAERAHMDRTYHLRRAGFMYRMIKIFQFSNARQGIPFVEIGVDKKPRLLLGVFEEGGQREPFKGHNVAVPITGSEARPGDMSTIPEQFTFRKMQFRRHTTANGKVQWRGENHTFLIPDVGVFTRTDQPQKTERRKKSFTGRAGRVLRETKLVKLLYKLMLPASMKRLPANLQLGRISRQQMQMRFSEYFTKFYSRYRN